MLTHKYGNKLTTCESDHFDSQNNLKSTFDAERSMHYIWPLMTWLAREFLKIVWRAPLIAWRGIDLLLCWILEMHAL